MQIVLENVQEKHLKLIAELAKNLNFRIVGIEEDDNHYLHAINEAENSPLLSEEEKVAFLSVLDDEDKTPYKTARKPVKATKKPSDFFGTLSEKEGEKMQLHVTDSRRAWERNI